MFVLALNTVTCEWLCIEQLSMKSLYKCLSPIDVRTDILYASLVTNTIMHVNRCIVFFLQVVCLFFITAHLMVQLSVPQIRDTITDMLSTRTN